MALGDVTDEYGCHDCGATIHPEVEIYYEIRTTVDPKGVLNEYSRFCSGECLETWQEEGGPTVLGE